MSKKKSEALFDLPELDELDEDQSEVFDLPTLDDAEPKRRKPEPPADPVETAIATVATYETAFQERAKTEQARLTLATDSEYWVCLCFETRQQKEAFLQRTKLADLGDKHINGLEVAKRLGVPFKPEERVKWPRRRGHANLSKLAGG